MAGKKAQRRCLGGRGGEERGISHTPMTHVVFLKQVIGYFFDSVIRGEISYQKKTSSHDINYREIANSSFENNQFLFLFLF